MNESSIGCPVYPPTDSETNPRAVFDQLFKVGTRMGHTKEKNDEFYPQLMTGKYGIRVHMMGAFWTVEGAVELLSLLLEFRQAHNIAIQTVWVQRHYGGPDGVHIWGAELKDCEPIK